MCVSCGCLFFFKGFYTSLARHEHWLALKMQLKPGQKVLDAGCGVGGPARSIARFADVYVTGVTINDYQVRRECGSIKKAPSSSAEFTHQHLLRPYSCVRCSLSLSFFFFPSFFLVCTWHSFL
jgi:SAM-dependent methyltransferase